MGTGRERDRELKAKERKERANASDEEERSDTKKEKSRDRGRDRSRERGRNRSRERGRDRSKERDKERRDGDRERKRKRSRERESRRDDFHEKRRRRDQKKEEFAAGKEEEKRRKGAEMEQWGEIKSKQMASGEVAKSSGGEISLSIEETNKLRESLGLKPLQIDKPEDDKTTASKEVHAPPSNIGSIKAAEKLKEKLETLREKRKQHKKLMSMKTLGEPAGDNESTLEWVKKSRTLQEEKEKAQKRAELLSEMDEEFGISELVQGALTPPPQQQQDYVSADLKGLKVEHSTEAFLEGRNTILTLKDAGVLDEADDVLINVNVVDSEKAARNVELRKKRSPYEDMSEVDSLQQKPSLLKKYDEEIEGIKKSAFELGDFGTVDTSGLKEAESVRQELEDRALTLQMDPAQVASEYYTKDEMVQFRKPKKKRKVRRMKANELESFSQSTADNSEMALDDIANDEIAQLRKPKMKKKIRQLKADDLLSLANEESDHGSRDHGSRTTTEGDVNDGDVIVLDTTAEFCRQLGEEEADTTQPKQKSGDLEGMDVQESDVQEAIGGWTEVELNAPKSSLPKEEELYQEAEPVVSSGLSAALRMATRKGFVDSGTSTKSSNEIVHVYSDVQRDREYERQKERERERDLSHSRTMTFPEKKAYNPHVNIEYVDDKGRSLTPKEAFRYMSHKFHGRGSGKRKTERRMKKLEEEHFMNKSSSIDTPLNTLAMLQSKQKKSQTPYIFISGGSLSMLAPDLEKK